MAERVTLSDFHALQATLLETRKALYESREREKKAVEKLRSTTAASFPPPPPRRTAAATPTPPRTAIETARYPEALNPFGNGSSNPFDDGFVSRPPPTAAVAAPNAGAASSGAAVPSVEHQPRAMPQDAREAAIRERCLAAMRARTADGRALLRLTFHAWRASHSLTCILRNMMLQARAGGATGAAGGGASASSSADAHPRSFALQRLLLKGERAAAEADVLVAELADAEAMAERGYQQGAAHGYRLGAEHGYRLAVDSAPAAANDAADDSEGPAHALPASVGGGSY